MRQTVADIFFSLLIGAVWTLAFESPMIVIEQVIFSKGKAREERNNTTYENDTKNSSWLCMRGQRSKVLRKEDA